MSRVEKTLLCATLVLAPFVLGCDLELPEGADAGASDPGLEHLPAPEEGGAAEATKPAMDPAEAHKLPGPDSAFPNDATQRAKCLQACADLEGSSDDQATCRLACGHEASLTETALRRYEDCRGACGDSAGPACPSGCFDALLREAGKAKALPAACVRACVDSRAACAADCASGKKADERATCSLHCETESVRCVDACPLLE